MSAHCSNDLRSDSEIEQDEAIQGVLRKCATAGIWPHSARGLRHMLASVGLIIVENGDVP